MNKKALLDAELFGRTGRIKTPSPPLVSDEDLEVVDLLSDSDGVHGEAKNSRSEGVCRCEEVQKASVEAPVQESKEETLREPHFVVCVGEEPENEDIDVPEKEDAAQSTSESEESEHRSDSEFVPSEEEPESDNTCSESCTEDDSTEEEGSEDDITEKQEPGATEKLRNQVCCII